MKDLLIVANWKENMDNEGAAAYIKKIKQLDMRGHEIVICPSHVSIITAYDCVQGSAIKVGAQDISLFQSGAYTGEVSASMLSRFCEYTIVGHSERRRYFSESDGVVNMKLRLALMNSIKPILCIGENQDEKKHNQTEHVLGMQLEKCLQEVTPEVANEITIAYEPIWAISGGDSGHEPATPESAEHVHQFIRHRLIEAPKAAFVLPPIEKFGNQIGGSIRLIYGGSVKPENAEGFFAKDSIDGGLVGNASLSVDSFYKIIDP